MLPKSIAYYFKTLQRYIIRFVLRPYGLLNNLKYFSEAKIDIQWTFLPFPATAISSFSNVETTSWLKFRDLQQQPNR